MIARTANMATTVTRNGGQEKRKKRKEEEDDARYAERFCNPKIIIEREREREKRENRVF